MTTSRKRAARCLFGVANHEEVTKQMKRELQEIYNRDAKQYNFDFVLGIPILGGGGAGAGDFEFEAISAEKVPAFYREKKVVKNKKPIMVAEEPSTSRYEKPVTRSASQAALKQTKLTNFMPIRKRRSETNLIRAQVESLKLTKRPMRPNPPPITGSMSDTTIPSPPPQSPQSPPAKMRFQQRRATTRHQQQRQHLEAGDFSG